jgi:aminopeptidase YwaD
MRGVSDRARSLVGVLAAVLLVASTAVPPPPVPAAPSSERLADDVKALSSPSMAGRRSGTPGAEAAARYIAQAFRSAGLAPAGDQAGYEQAFEVPTGVRLGAANSLAIVTRGARTLALGRHFMPLTVSGDGARSGDVVFAGYGITAPDLGYDDYAGIDVRGKIVVVMTGEPRGRDPSSPFRKPEAYHYSERRHKVINAREHGAAAVLLVAHPGAASDVLPTLAGVAAPWSVLAVAVVRPVVDAVLAPSGTSLAAAADAIDRPLAPRSFVVPGVRVAVEVKLVRERSATANVVGILRGSDPALKDEAVVVGAHYDHLGLGGEGSLEPDRVGVVHPGADDNASGTAAVMELARSFAAAGPQPRTLVFVAFAGEEMGLLGSAEYVRRPPVPLDRTVAMVNLDMVGRPREGKVYVTGVDSGSGLRTLVADAARGLALQLELRGDPFAPSDQTSFYAAGRPVLFLFTGAHDDYHRPSDTWDKIDRRGLATVTELAGRIIAALATAQAPPVYAKIEAPRGGGTSGGRGYGPFFGVVPDFGEPARAGVKINGVRPASPAERAGLRVGDVMVRFGGVQVSTLDDLTFALRSHRAGDEIEVRWVRDGEEQQGRATLQERR